MLIIMYRWRILPDANAQFLTDWELVESVKAIKVPSALLRVGDLDNILLIQFENRDSAHDWIHTQGWQKFCAKWEGYRLSGPEKLTTLAGSGLDAVIVPFSVVEVVEKAVCEHLGVSWEKLKAGMRRKDASFARHLAMWFCEKRLRLSPSEIGRRFDRDRKTAAHGISRIKELLHEKYVLPGPENLPGPKGVPLSDVVDRIKDQLKVQLKT